MVDPTVRALSLHPLDPATATDLAQAFKALGDPVRLQILSRITSADSGEICVCDMRLGFDLTGPTISHHLKLLREAGLIDGQRRGTWVYYRPKRERLATLSALLAVTSPVGSPARRHSPVG